MCIKIGFHLLKRPLYIKDSLFITLVPLYSTVIKTVSVSHILAVNSVVGWCKSAFSMSVYFFWRGWGIYLHLNGENKLSM